MYARAFWPTKGDVAAGEYAGEAACAICHADIASLQHQTPMYHAATPASLLSLHSPLKFQESTFSYAVQQTTSGTIYLVDSVSASGSHSDSRAVAWAFGNSETGQTYLLRQKDGYIESRLSYYTALNALDITVGHSGQLPSSPHDALGHELAFETAQRCFACHTTASTLSNVFVPEKSVPGVTCEACHGPGAAHVVAAKTGKVRQTIASVINPLPCRLPILSTFAAPVTAPSPMSLSLCQPTSARSRSVFSPTAWRRAVAGERPATHVSPASPVMTPTGRWSARVQPTTTTVSLATTQGRLNRFAIIPLLRPIRSHPHLGAR